jgi:hypothetical protein
MSNLIEKDWTTNAGLRAVVVICLSDDGKRKRHRCGYVGVDNSHPLFGVQYNDQSDKITKQMVEDLTLGGRSPILLLTAAVNSDDGQSIRRSPDVLFDVHGGLTFSSGNKMFDPDYPIKSDLWWFGFDCTHCDDGVIEPDEFDMKYFRGQARSLEYVSAQCESLATQMAMMVGIPLTEKTK